MLRGWTKTRIDGKGRIFLGVRAKQELGDTAFIIYGSVSHILVTNEENFRYIEKHIQDRIDLSTYSGFLKAMGAKTQSFLRNFYSLHASVEVDEQGRITIPKFLREHVFLQGELVVYSLGWCIEVWKATEAPPLKPEVSIEEALGKALENEGSKGVESNVAD